MRRFYILIAILGVAFISMPINAGQEDNRLDLLFANLAKSTSAGDAKKIEHIIWRIWSENKNSPAERVLALGVKSMNSGALNAALQAFNEVVKLAPNFAEGWNKRATVFYLLQDYSSSVKDIAQTLRLEPRHFGALSGLGLINTALGRHGAAVKAFEEAIQIHPYMVGARHHIKVLKEILKGEET
jgi:tetratricopeptide (TPR) repeat protein